MESLTIGPRESIDFLSRFCKDQEGVRDSHLFHNLLLSRPRDSTTQLKQLYEALFLGTKVERPRHLEEFAALCLVKRVSLPPETSTSCLLRDLEVLGQDAMPLLQCGDLDELQ